MTRPAEERHISQPSSEPEPPGVERPASVSPTESQLEYESPVGYGAGEPSPLGGEKHDPYAALRNRNYCFYSLGWFISTIGHQIQSVAVGYEVYQLTKREISLGWVGLAQALPVLLLSLPAGHVADRYDRRTVVRISLVAAAFCSLVLAGISYWGAKYNWDARVGWMYALLALNASARSLGWPARASLLPQIVPPEHFNNAVTWNSSFFHTASVVGPSVAGVVLAYLGGAKMAYVLNAAGDMVLFVMLGALTLRPIARSTEAPSWASLLAGFHFVWRTKVILATITLDLLAVLLGGATFLLPAVAEQILHVGPVELGWLRASTAVGAFLGSILIAHMPPMRRAGLAMLWSVAGFGAATIVFGLSKSLWLSLAMLALAGAFDTVSVVVRHTLIQVLPPDEMRGRVAAVNTVFIGASNELGGFESGVTAAWFGLARSIVIGGIGTLLVTFGVGAWWPQVRRLGSLRHVRPMALSGDAADYQVAGSAGNPKS
jgi:MFS family permease